jgi:hypothetical protein
VANERYHVLIDKLNSFKQFDNEDASSLYSRLNLLVNEVNSLDVKKIEELELICKILHSLRRPDYDLVTTILYEKELKTTTPNQVLNKVIAHELRNGIKPREPPSSPTHSALASKQAKMLKKMVIQESSSDEEEEDAAKSSSSEKEEMDRKLLKEAKIMNKSLKKINMMGYMIFLKDGHHHQLMKVKRNKYKKNNQGKKDKKPKHEALSIFGVWVSGGEESSTSSSDESIKRFTTRTNIGASSLNMCLMSKGMESDVSDDDSDSPSFEDLLELIHEQQRVMKRQAKEIKQLNAFNDLNASLATNYDDLLCKFKLLSKEHEELKLKIESIKNETNDSLKMEQSIPCAIPIFKVNASTSCIYLIDESCSNPCNEKCYENVVVKSCDDLIAKKNDELKQEVERLMRNLA